MPSTILDHLSLTADNGSLAHYEDQMLGEDSKVLFGNDFENLAECPLLDGIFLIAAGKPYARINGSFVELQTNTSTATEMPAVVADKILTTDENSNLLWGERVQVLSDVKIQAGTPWPAGTLLFNSTKKTHQLSNGAVLTNIGSSSGASTIVPTQGGGCVLGIGAEVDPAAFWGLALGNSKVSGSGTIVISSDYAQLDGTAQSALYVSPIRDNELDKTYSRNLSYNIQTKEVTFKQPGATYSDTSVYSVCLGHGVGFTGGAVGSVHLGYNAGRGVGSSIAGTVSTVADSTTVTGVGTSFTSDFVGGDYVEISGYLYRVGSNPSSDTSMMISPAARATIDNTNLVLKQAAGSTIALGKNSNEAAVGDHSIAIGEGSDATLAHCISVGKEAKNDGKANTVVLNASSSALNATHSDGLFVKPVREVVTSKSLFYNESSGEITHGILPGSSEFSVSGLGNQSTQLTLASHTGGQLSVKVWQGATAFRTFTCAFVTGESTISYGALTSVSSGIGSGFTVSMPTNSLTPTFVATVGNAFNTYLAVRVSVI